MAAYLGKLSDDEKLALEADMAKRIAEEVAKVAAGFKVTVTNHAIPTPAYDRSKMTSNHYFSQCEKYFRSQHHKDQDFVYLFGTLLKSDEKLWYDNSVTDATTWAELKVAFKKLFDTAEDKDKREKILANKVQGSEETIASHVYQMVCLAGQVHPNEAMEDKVYRAYKSLHPRIRQLVHWSSIDKTQEGLIAASNFVLDNLHKTQKLEELGKTKLPPINVIREKGNNANDNVKSEESGSSRQAQANHRGQSSTSYRGRGFRNRGNYRGRGYSRGYFHNQNTDSLNKGNDHSKQVSSHKSSNFNSKNAKVDTKIRCFECKGYGHKREACPKVKGVAMSCTTRQANLLTVETVVA
ncbi:unnamed protein product [Allacma fusca]|uniref:CCHC-type domain-containing protein n=1 Tax=Allacma fusca TaxID=39272 RepID=A0A8J2LYW0_9HEXA|nr:unnamed protein product [Allacma fusca]